MLFRQHPEHLGAFQNLDTFATQIIQFQRVSWDGRCQHDKLYILRNKARVIDIMNADAFVFKTMRQWRWSTVIARHFIALGFEISRQGTHPDATDS